MSTNKSPADVGVDAQVEPHQIFHCYELIDGEHLRVAVTRPDNAHPTPLLIFNGIGASLDIVEPFMRRASAFRPSIFSKARGKKRTAATTC